MNDKQVSALLCELRCLRQEMVGMQIRREEIYNKQILELHKIAVVLETIESKGVGIRK